MKIHLKRLIWAIAVCMIAVAITACGLWNQNGTETETESETVTSESETVTFFNKDDTNVKVIYASGSGANVKSTDVSSLVSALNARFGMNLKASVDKTTKENAGVKEILVGVTNRAESTEAATGLATSDYVVKLVGNKLVILGENEDATARAIAYFASTYLAQESDALKLPKDLNVKWVFATEAAKTVELARTFFILYGEGSNESEKSAAKNFAAKLATLTGETVSAKSDTSHGGKYNDTDYVSNDKEILIGKTNRRESTQVRGSLGLLDWEVRFVNNKIVVAGGTADGTAQALSWLIGQLSDGAVKELSASGVDKLSLASDILTNAASPAANYAAFAPVWASTYTAPSWITNQSEKLFAITAPDARNMSASEGGDVVNYPAYSLEALTSAVKAGVDVLFVNVYKTQDGVAVVAQSSNLKGITNVAQIAGTPGYPITSKIEDWTYEQLQALRYFDSKGKATESRICTLYEAVKLCHGRCMLSFVYPDVDLTETTKAVLQSLDAFEVYFEADVTDRNMTVPKLLRTLRTWRDEGITSSSLTATIAKYEADLKLSNHWMRRLFYNDAQMVRGVSDYFAPENLRMWAERGYNFFYASDIVSYCKYIATEQGSALVNADYRPNSNGNYTIDSGKLGGRILIISDIHYHPLNNHIGYTKEEKMQLVVDQITKEKNSARGLDAVVVVGDLSTDNNCYYEVSALPSGATKYRDDVVDGTKTYEFYVKNSVYYRVVKENGTTVKVGYLRPSGNGSDLTNYYEEAWNNYLKPLKTSLGIPIYVLPGNHDSDIGKRWQDVFGYDRQFSVQIKDTAIICLDTFNDADEEDDNTIPMAGHGGDYREIDHAYLEGELAKFPESSDVKRILIFAHRILNNDKRYLDGLAAKDKRILAAYDGDSHTYNVEPYTNMWFLNDGNVAYSAMSDENGGWSFTTINGVKQSFGYLDVRNIWGYMIFEWGEDASGNEVDVTYRMLFEALYKPYNMPGGYSVPETKHSDIIVSRS